MLNKMDRRESLSFVGLAVFLFLAAGSIDNPQNNSQGSKAAVESSQKNEAGPKTYIKENCRQVSDHFDSQSNLTDIQKDELWERKYKDRYFKWNLIPTEVRSNMLGGYAVQFKCEDSRSLILDVQLQYSSDAKSLVIQYQKGNIYHVSGKLTHQHSLLGLSGDGLE